MDGFYKEIQGITAFRKVFKVDQENEDVGTVRYDFEDCAKLLVHPWRTFRRVVKGLKDRRKSAVAGGGSVGGVLTPDEGVQA